MGAIILIIGWFILSYIIASAKNTASVVVNPLKIRILTEKIDKIDVFSVYAKGKWQMPYGVNSLVFIIRLYQEMNDEKYPVMCMIKEWTGDDNLFFNYVSDFSTPGSGTIGFTKEVKMISIPTEALKFAHKGDLNLVFELNLVSLVNNEPAIFRSTTNKLKYSVIEQGYKDRIEGLKKFNENIIKIAAIVSSIDGLSDYEEDVVIDWLDDNQFFDDQEELLEIFDQTVDSNSSFNDGIIKINTLVNEIKSFASPADKMNILNLLHKISISDNVHSNDEEKMIRHIVTLLEIDEERYNQMIFKDVNLNSTDSIKKDFDKLLGIKDGMSDSEFKEQLKEQYKIWNNKVTSSNIIESKNAKKVLEYISERRSNL